MDSLDISTPLSMTPNPVLTQLPKAQDAFDAVMTAYADVDTTSTLLAINQCIQASVARGQMVTQLGGIEDLRVAEKAAIELQELGYAAQTCNSGQAIQPDGSIRSLFGIVLNWRWMPQNARDAFSV